MTNKNYSSWILNNNFHRIDKIYLKSSRKSTAFFRTGFCLVMRMQRETGESGSCGIARHTAETHYSLSRGNEESETRAEKEWRTGKPCTLGLRATEYKTRSKTAVYFLLHNAPFLHCTLAALWSTDQVNRSNDITKFTVESFRNNGVYKRKTDT